MPLRALALAAFLTSVFASPASELFREASFYLEFYYYGPAQTPPQEVTARYHEQLEQACAPQGEACGFEVARPLIAQMLRDLGDGHTYYLAPEDFRSALERAGGTAAARPLVGLQLGPAVPGAVLIQDIVTGSPAEAAGLRPGDRIVGVNGTPPSSAEVLRQQLASDAPVRLQIARGDVARPEQLEVSLRRRAVVPLELPYAYNLPSLPGVVVIRIPQFATYGQVGPRVHALVRQAQEQHAKAILLDVRNNGGGEETECVSAAAAFIGDYEISMQSRLGRSPLGFREGATLGNDPRDPRGYSIPAATLWRGPVAVLVNRRSASCAEVFAYLLQRAGRAPVVGERTAGVTNTATDFFPLLDHSAVAITYVRTLNSDGSPLPDFVQPDAPVSDDPAAWLRTGRDPVIERALEVLRLRH